MKLIDFTLPEFCFLDGNCHECNYLAERTVIMHVRTSTVMEIIAKDNITEIELKVPSYEFLYKNIFNTTEKHIIAVHFSLIWEKGMPLNDDLLSLFKITEAWYCDYLKWEDTNIENQNTTNSN